MILIFQKQTHEKNSWNWYYSYISQILFWNTGKLINFTNLYCGFGFSTLFRKNNHFYLNFLLPFAWVANKSFDLLIGFWSFNFQYVWNTSFSKFYGKVGVISQLLFHLIWKNYGLYWDSDSKSWIMDFSLVSLEKKHHKTTFLVKISV